jgi:hypothetical protein
MKKTDEWSKPSKKKKKKKKDLKKRAKKVPLLIYPVSYRGASIWVAAPRESVRCLSIQGSIRNIGRSGRLFIPYATSVLLAMLAPLAIISIFFSPLLGKC